VNEFFKDKVSRYNLLIFVVMSVACSFSYYLINFFIKYMPGSFYQNQAINGASESLCNVIAIFMNKYLNQKKSLLISFLVCAISCALVMVAEMTEITAIIPIGVVGGKGGITIAFCFFYFITVDYFAPHYLGLVMGISNFFGRFSTVLAPAIAEVDEPVPMMTCIIICLMAGIMCLQLKVPQDF